MRTKDKKDYILELYAKQIESIPFVSSDGVKFHMVDAFICPLCLHTYAIGNTELTLEHVPPESVGGKPVLITCKACNSNRGADIDVCLMNELEIVHNLTHFDTIPQKTKLTFNGFEINAQTIFSKTDGFKFMINPDNNNPIEFEGLDQLLNVRIFGLKSRKPTLRNFSAKNDIEDIGILLAKANIVTLIRGIAVSL